ncbi:MAG: hypothetical protein E7403_06605 [Ruminococcaceae bacterium]|nr:hypothetical protein [Oscillospiraceae bacterium]
MYRIQKKKKGIGFYLILFLSAFVVGLGIGYGTIKMNTGRKENNLNPPEIISPSATAQPPDNQPASLNIILPTEAPDPKPQYFVIAQEDTVAVFTFDEEGDKRFSYKLAIDVDALPPVDQKLFSEGIYLYSKQELLELTEDFSS